MTVAEVTFDADLPGHVCTGCDESYVANDVLGRFELSVSAELARLGRRTPEAFRFMRKALGYKASELATLLGVAAESVSRWENGAIPVEPRAFVLVGGMADDALAGRDATVGRLRALSEPVNVTSPIRLQVG